MKRPYVICHMTPSVDGRIDVTRWKLAQAVFDEYERTAQTFRADAWMIGRVSMEPYAGKARVPARKRGPAIPRTDFIARQADRYAIGLDPGGKLTWRSGAIDDEHVISVLSEKVSDAYLAFLRDRGVSYLFGGKSELNLGRVLGKLRQRFGIEKLLLEGGGKINGSFVAAGLVDELSLLYAPLTDGSLGTPTLFDTGSARPPIRHLQLISCEKRAGDSVWLRYRVQGGRK